MIHHLKRMLRSMAWADQRALTALRECPAAMPEALPLLAHVLAAEHVWLSRVEGQPARLPVWPGLSTSECERLATENAAGYAALIERTDPANLEKLIQYRNQRGEEFRTSLLDILTHVVIHGSYHRGQVARIIGRAGGKAADTDFIIFARDVEPTPGAGRLS